MEGFENLAQKLHLDGTVGAGIDRPKKCYESGHLAQILNQIPMHEFFQVTEQAKY
jgi:hypothetical protein